ncbi:unnamed protein product [Clavelina lepadiformis]|uniref:Uncharacterized protein n=1 Tax=Clavelina lepadiformis TaxID=159417 RepID=A0ABP0FFN8_CLALP
MRTRIILTMTSLTTEFDLRQDCWCIRDVERHEKQSAGRNNNRQQSDEPSGCPSDCTRHADADNTYNDILNDWGSIYDRTVGAYGT